MILDEVVPTPAVDPSAAIRSTSAAELVHNLFELADEARHQAHRLLLALADAPVELGWAASRHARHLARQVDRALARGLARGQTRVLGLLQ